MYVFIMARTNQRTTACLMAATGLVLCLLHPCLANAKAVSVSGKDARVSQIIAAWRKRQDAIHTVRATLELQIVLKPGSLRPVPGIPPSKKAEVESTQLVTVLLDFDNKRYRVDRSGGVYDFTHDKVCPRESMSVFVNGKGKTYRRFHGIETKRQGFIGGEGGFDKLTFRDVMMVPLLLYVRPCGGLPGLTSWQECAPLRIVSSSRGILRCECGHSTLWVDTHRDYAVVRYGPRSQRLTIDYGPDEGYGPVPTRSRCVPLDRRGEIESVRTTRVKHIDINVPFTDSMFELAFPEGTEVVVIADSPRPSMVANAKGQLVPKQPIDHRANSGTTWRWLWPWIVPANVVILIVIAMLVLRRRLQHT